MPVDDIFCGAGKVPSGKRRGTMKECVEKNQFRYWGVKQIDARLLDQTKAKKTMPSTRYKLMEKMIGIDGKIKQYNLKIKHMKNPKKSEVQEVEDQIEKLKEERAKYKIQLAKVEAKSESSSKTKTKSSSKSKKKTKTKTKPKKTKKAKKVKSKTKKTKKAKKNQSRPKKAKSKRSKTKSKGSK